MKKIIFSVVVLGISATVLFNSCKKKTEVDNETQSAVDFAVCEQQFMAVAPTVNTKGVGSPKAAGFKTSSCAPTWSINSSNVTSDTLVDANAKYANPVEFILEYPTTNCTDIDNMSKSGRIKIKSTHKWSLLSTLSTSLTTVASATITFDNYRADGVKYEGTVILSKTANSINTKVIGGKCTKDSWNIGYDCDKTITIDNTTNDITIVGNASGTNREGRKYTVNIGSAIVKKTNCKYISSGTLELTPDGFKTRTIDFGNGTCDNDATFTVGGQTVAFKLQ